MFKKIFAIAASLFICSSLTWAEKPSRQPELRLCSQNLFRFAEKRSGKSSFQQEEKQKNYLISRFLRARCDVVALQEVVGASKREAARTAELLANALSYRSGRKFRVYVGDSYDQFIRNGYLVAEDLGQVEIENFSDEPLPRLQPLGPIGRFIRSPLALKLTLSSKESAAPKKLFILNIHFKSKSRADKDPTGTAFETVRMEMAEAVRTLIAKKKKEATTDTIFVALGDRNADSESATAEIMSGERLLDDFGKNGSCQLDTDNNPECTTGERRPELMGLFWLRRERYPEEYRGGTYLYKRQEEILDEIYVLPEDLEFLKRPSGRFAIGIDGEYYKGSDHKLVWAEFDW